MMRRAAVQLLKDTKDYLDEEAQAKFAARGIGLEFSDHHKTTGDSIVTVLMDYDEPMEIVARERTET